MTLLNIIQKHNCPIVNSLVQFYLNFSIPVPIVYSILYFCYLRETKLPFKFRSFINWQFIGLLEYFGLPFQFVALPANFFNWTTKLLTNYDAKYNAKVIRVNKKFERVSSEENKH